jgi:hypothetical protein
MKTKIFRIYFYIVSVVMLFWWPLSHWLYPDIYHNLLGFQSYNPAMVTVIGTLSFFAVLGLFFVARNPIRNRDFFISLLIMSVLMAATYLYLIQTGQFPALEYINILLLLGNGIIACLIYPWKEALKSLTSIER